MSRHGRNTREPLAEAIARLGADVATHDHRFEPLHDHELPRVDDRLSILTAPEP